MVNHVAKKHRLSIFDDQRFQIAKKKKKEILNIITTKPAKETKVKSVIPFLN